MFYLTNGISKISFAVIMGNYISKTVRIFNRALFFFKKFLHLFFLIKNTPENFQVSTVLPMKKIFIPVNAN